MDQVQVERYGRARDHYARELLGGRSFVRWTWASNTVLALTVAGMAAWSHRVTVDAAGRVQPYVVAFDHAAHPVPLDPSWSPQAGQYLELATTYARYVRSRPADAQVTAVQREWVRARTDRTLEPVLRRSLLALDEELGGDALEVELVSAAVERVGEGGAVIQVRWRERTRFRAGGAGKWRPWIALLALYFDPTRTRQEEVIPNPTRVYVTHFEPSPEA